MREIYGTSGKYTKSNFFDHFVVYGERSIFTLKEYWEHQQKRGLMAGFWSKSSIMKGEVQEGIKERVRAFLKVIEESVRDGGGEVNVYALNNCFAFDVVTRIVYGKKHGARTIEGECRERSILLGLKQSQVWGPLKFNFPWFPNWRLANSFLPKTFTEGQTADKDLEEWNLKRLEKALGDEEDGEYTLLSKLRLVRDKEGKRLGRGYVAAETYDDVLAGQETTAVALTYVMWYLSRNPEWQAKVCEEVRALRIEEGGLPNAGDVDAAPLLNAFVTEVLRVNPGSGGRQERLVPRGGKVYEGFFLPEGVRPPFSPPPPPANPRAKIDARIRIASRPPPLASRLSLPLHLRSHPLALLPLLARATETDGTTLHTFRIRREDVYRQSIGAGGNENVTGGGLQELGDEGRRGHAGGGDVADGNDGGRTEGLEVCVMGGEEVGGK